MTKVSERRVVMSARRAVTETWHRAFTAIVALRGPGPYLQVSERAGGEGVTRSWIYRFVSPVTGKPRWMVWAPRT